MGQGASTAADPTDGMMLGIAASGGHSDIADMYLEKNPALAFYVCKDMETVIHCACRSGNHEILSRIVDAISKSALSNTFSPLVRQLDHQDNSGRTALMLACQASRHAQAGSEQCAKMLIEQGADIWLKDQQGRSALHYSAHPGGNGCCNMLLMQAAVEEQQHQQGLLPGTSRTVIGYVNLPDIHGRTALHYAAWVGELAISDSLLTAGACLTAQATSDCCDAQLPCNSGSTPLHLATLRGHAAVVLLLLTSYVDAVVEEAESRRGSVSASTQPGQTPGEGPAASRETFQDNASYRHSQHDQLRNNNQQLQRHQPEQEPELERCNSVEAGRRTSQHHQPHQREVPDWMYGDIDLLAQYEEGPQPPLLEQERSQHLEQQALLEEELLDPRGVLDAYGATPYSIAARQKDEMLMKILDPKRPLIELAHDLPGYISSALNGREDAEQVAMARDRVSRALALWPSNTGSPGSSSSSSLVRRPPAGGAGAAGLMDRVAEGLLTALEQAVEGLAAAAGLPAAMNTAAAGCTGGTSSSSSAADLLARVTMATEQHNVQPPDCSKGGAGRARGDSDGAEVVGGQQQVHSGTGKAPPYAAILGMVSPSGDEDIVTPSPKMTAAAVAPASKSGGVECEPFASAADVARQAQSSPQPQQQPAMALGPAEMAIWAVEAELLRIDDESSHGY